MSLLRMTAQDIEIAVARHFNHRVNLIVPNVHWGWNLRHEADMIIVRQSGYCDEIEIKVTLADIKADAKKHWSHWESRKIARVWFAVPHWLAESQYIPKEAGVLSVMRGKSVKTQGGLYKFMPITETDTTFTDVVTVLRPAKLRDRNTREKIGDKDRLKLAELGAMRIWSLKSALAARRGNR